MEKASKAKLLLLADKVFKKGNFEIAVVDGAEYLLLESGVQGPYSYTQLLTDSIIGADRTVQEQTEVIRSHSVNAHEIVYIDGTIKELNNKNYRRILNTIAKNILLKDNMRAYLKDIINKPVYGFIDEKINGPAKYFSDKYAIRIVRKTCTEYTMCGTMVQVYVGLNSISDKADGIGVWNIQRKAWECSPSATNWAKNCCENCEFNNDTNTESQSRARWRYENE